MKIENKQNVLYKNLTKFYSVDANMKKLLYLLDKNSPVSLREWDYLCTHYARQHNVVFYTSKKELINLNLAYRSQLKAYSKANFDPFKRHNRITIPCKFIESKQLETTCGQLCFFKFILEKEIFDWLNKNKNLENLRKDMTQFSKSKKSKDTNNIKKTASSLSKSIKRHDVKITVVFE